MSFTGTIIDTETTGLDPETCGVVEIGLVDVEDGEVVGTDSSFVNPGHPIPPMASATHHIVDADIERAPPLKQVMKDLNIEGRGTLVAHNAPFDAAFLGHDPSTWLDTLRLAKHTWPDAENHKLQYLRYWLPLEVDDRGIPAHRALGDALVTAALANVLLPQIDDPWTLQATPVRQEVCRFGKKHWGALWSDVPGSYLNWMKKNVTDLDEDTQYTLDCECRERGI